MSEAISGMPSTTAPGCRYAHPGYDSAGGPSALLVHDAKLLDAAAEILIGGKFGGEVGRDEVHGEPGADNLCANAHDIDVVMLDALMGGMDVVADRGADTLHLVGRDRGADAGAADHDAARGFARRHLLRHRACDVGEVDRFVVMGADIEDVVAEAADVVDNCLLERPAGV